MFIVLNAEHALGYVVLKPGHTFVDLDGKELADKRSADRKQHPRNAARNMKMTQESKEDRYLEKR